MVSGHGVEKFNSAVLELLLQRLQIHTGCAARNPFYRNALRLKVSQIEIVARLLDQNGLISVWKRHPSQNFQSPLSPRSDNNLLRLGKYLIIRQVGYQRLPELLQPS
ncbi:hypothetical protein D1872_251620 [compost metagenome]